MKNVDFRNRQVESQLAGCGLLAFLDGIENYPPGPPTFSKSCSVSGWTFPMKLSSHGDGKLQSDF